MIRTIVSSSRRKEAAVCCFHIYIYLCTVLKEQRNILHEISKRKANWIGHMIYDMIYLTAIGQPPGGSSSVHIYTQTVQRTTQTVHRRTKKKYIEQHKK